MSINTKKLEKALFNKGIVATVTWTPIAREDADSGITGFYSEQLDSMGLHIGTLGYSVEEALHVIASIKNPGAGNRILNCNNSNIPASCTNTILIDCNNFSAPEGSTDVVYRNNVLDTNTY